MESRKKDPLQEMKNDFIGALRDEVNKRIEGSVVAAVNKYCEQYELDVVKKEMAICLDKFLSVTAEKKREEVKSVCVRLIISAIKEHEKKQNMADSEKIIDIKQKNMEEWEKYDKLDPVTRSDVWLMANAHCTYISQEPWNKNTLDKVLDYLGLEKKPMFNQGGDKVEKTIQGTYDEKILSSYRTGDLYQNAKDNLKKRVGACYDKSSTNMILLCASNMSKPVQGTVLQVGCQDPDHSYNIVTSLSPEEIGKKYFDSKDNSLNLIQLAKDDKSFRILDSWIGYVLTSPVDGLHYGNQICPHVYSYGIIGSGKLMELRGDKYVKSDIDSNMKNDTGDYVKAITNIQRMVNAQTKSALTSIQDSMNHQNMLNIIKDQSVGIEKGKHTALVFKNFKF